MRPLGKEEKVFGIGLSKTATSTLSEALNILGVRSIHYPHDATTFEELRRGQYRLSLLNHFQAVADTPVAPYYAQLDRAWPGSRFILTVREKDAWLASAKSHWDVLKVNGHYAQDERFQSFADFISAVVYGCTYYSEERFSYAYDTHQRNVLEYFAARPRDLLVLDICGGEGWNELCAFLGMAVPEGIAFPHANRSSFGVAERVKEDLAGVAPDGQTVIVVDHEGLRNYLAGFRRVMPFLEVDGRYGGLPEDDAAAVRELERQRAERRAEFFAVASSALWFMDRFSGFAGYLRSRYPCVLNNERLLIYDVRP